MVRTVDEAALEANFAGVKGAIRVEQAAELKTHLRRTGAHLKGLCPYRITTRRPRASCATRTRAPGGVLAAIGAGTSWICGRPSKGSRATSTWLWKTSQSTSASSSGIPKT